MSLFRSAVVVGILTLISRVFGYARDIFIAAFLGSGPIADAFLVAFRLPNFFRRLFGEGALSSSFIPLFSSTLTGDGKVSAMKFAAKVFTLLLLILIAFTVLVQLAMPWVMHLLAPGFTDDKAQFDLCVYLGRVTMPYLLFISLVALLGGMLNSVGRFAAAAGSPIILNVCMVIAIAYFSRFTETPAHALAWGVTVAGFLQCVAISISCYRAKVMPGLTKPTMDPLVKKLFITMGPGILGIGIVQINLWVDTIVATYLSNGAVSLLYYADRLNQLPLALIGTAIGTVLLPTLSKQMREHKKEEALETQNRALETALLLSLPAAIALSVIAYPIMSVLFKRGAFTTEDAIGTSMILMMFALGLPAFVMNKIFTPGFLALHDTRTPVIIAVISLISNIVLNIIFLKTIATPAGIALATSISAWLNVAQLWLIATKRGIFLIDARLKKRLPRILFSSLVMAAVLAGSNSLLNSYLEHPSTTIKFLSLLVIIAAGSVSFIGTAIVTNAFVPRELLEVIRRKKAAE